MKFRISAGHAQGKGACGFMEESKEARNIVSYVKSDLKSLNHTVVDCTNNIDTDPTTNLRNIVKNHNITACDTHVSVHLNGFEKSKTDGKNKGCEVLITGNHEETRKQGEQICKNLAKLGFTNRGVKIRKDLYFLNETYGKSLLIEVCFVDDEDDYKLYKKLGYEKISKAIAYGLLQKDLPTIKYRVTADFKLLSEAKKVKKDLGHIASNVNIKEVFK